jgi:hypothetical protein
VTTPSGSGSAVAGRSPRAEDDDDVRDDDPKLRAMRAVWLTMRDEEPPERGMAELLAAARSTAEAMQAHPTLWQRLVVGLRRPPALAFATLVVLVGGAVIVGRHDAEVPAARSPAASGVVAMEPAPAGEAQLDLANESTGREKGPGKAAEAVTRARRDDLFSGPGAEPAVPAPVAAKPALKRRAASDAPAGADRKDLDEGAADDREAPVPRGTVAPAPDAPATVTTGKVAGARPRRPEPMREPPRSAGDVDGAASHESTASADAGEATKQVRVEATAARQDKEDRAAPVVPLAQLYQQCEAAARRGDCAAVRLMVDRIATSDRGYRARVPKGSPVAKCLAE